MFIFSLLKSLLSGVFIGVSSFLYSTALRVVDSSKVYELGHLAGSVVFSVGPMICCIFKLPIFVGRLGSIFDNPSTKLMVVSFPAMMIGNIAGATGIGIVAHYILKHTSLIPIVENIVESILNLHNFNQYFNCLKTV